MAEFVGEGAIQEAPLCEPSTSNTTVPATISVPVIASRRRLAFRPQSLMKSGGKPLASKPIAGKNAASIETSQTEEKSALNTEQNAVAKSLVQNVSGEQTSCEHQKLVRKRMITSWTFDETLVNDFLNYDFLNM